MNKVNGNVNGGDWITATTQLPTQAIISCNLTRYRYLYLFVTSSHNENDFLLFLFHLRPFLPVLLLFFFCFFYFSLNSCEYSTVDVAQSVCGIYIIIWCQLWLLFVCFVTMCLEISFTYPSSHLLWVLLLLLCLCRIFFNSSLLCDFSLCFIANEANENRVDVSIFCKKYALSQRETLSQKMLQAFHIAFSVKFSLFAFTISISLKFLSFSLSFELSYSLAPLLVYSFTRHSLITIQIRRCRKKCRQVKENDSARGACVMLDIR